MELFHWRISGGLNMKWNHSGLPTPDEPCLCDARDAYRIMYYHEDGLWYVCDQPDFLVETYSNVDVIGWVYLDDILSSIEH